MAVARVLDIFGLGRPELGTVQLRTSTSWYMDLGYWGQRVSLWMPFTLCGVFTLDRIETCWRAPQKV